MALSVGLPGAPTIVSVITAHTWLDLVYVQRLCHPVSNLMPWQSSVKHSENLFPLFQKLLLKLKHLIYFHNLNPLQLATRLSSRHDQHLPLNLCAPRQCVSPQRWPLPPLLTAWIHGVLYIWILQILCPFVSGFTLRPLICSNHWWICRSWIRTAASYSIWWLFDISIPTFVSGYGVNVVASVLVHVFWRPCGRIGVGTEPGIDTLNHRTRLCWSLNFQTTCPHLPTAGPTAGTLFLMRANT